MELQVAWTGRVAASTYRTTVIWEFSKAQHLRLVVVSDTSGAPVPPEVVAELDAYFRSTVFQSVQVGTSGVLSLDWGQLR